MEQEWVYHMVWMENELAACDHNQQKLIKGKEGENEEK